MQERQAQWGHPAEPLSPSKSPENINPISTSQSTEPSPLSHTHQLYSFINPQRSHIGASFNANNFGLGGYISSTGSTPSQADTPLVPMYGNVSARGRPKTKFTKPKPQGLGTERKARKKVAKACLACQKSHLTCDEQRPCTRCIKKGMGDKCVEGVRKKAKYLLEGDERAAATGHLYQSQQSSVQSTPGSLTQTLPPVPNVMPLLSNPNQGDPMHLSDDSWITTAVQRDIPPNDIALPPGLNLAQTWSAGASTDVTPNGGFAGFNDNAANNEYEMLNAMFASISPAYPGRDPMDEAGGQLAAAGAVPDPSGAMDLGLNNVANLDQAWFNQSPGQSTLYQQTSSCSSVPVGISPTTYSRDASPNNQWSGWMDAPAGQIMLDGSGGKSGPTRGQDNGHDNGQNGSGDVHKTRKGLTSAEVYRTIVRPYDYTQGYHFLIEYLSKQFEPQDVLRVVRSLASFRPSLIALQMQMSEEDEVFLERSFQRTLIELEKLISYSATPTAVWRRTGEVCYANPEFCSLVKKSDIELLEKKTYIYELLSKTSVVSYWENFSVHAFENTTQNFFQPLAFKMDGDRGVGCTCCFTIRRDVFDLPSVVIGQFLPVSQ